MVIALHCTKTGLPGEAGLHKFMKQIATQIQQAIRYDFKLMHTSSLSGRAWAG